MFGSREEDFIRNDAFSQHDLYDHAFTQQLFSGGYDIYNFRRPFLGHDYFIFSLSGLFFGVEKNFFKGIHQIYTCYPRYPTNTTHQI